MTEKSCIIQNEFHFIIFLAYIFLEVKLPFGLVRVQTEPFSLKLYLSIKKISSNFSNPINSHHTRELTPHHTSWFSTTKRLNFEEVARDQFNLIT